MGRVVVVGSLNVDRPWRVGRHPVVGETVPGRSLVPLPGGKGLNLAVAARRMAVEVALVGAVGDDPDGRWLRRVATDEDIDTAGVVTTSDAATGCALIVIDDAGANTVTVDAGANATVTTPALGLGAGDVVIAPLEVPSDAIAAAFAQARSAGARTILNPSPVAEVNHLLALTDVVLVNEHEAAALAGTTVVDVQTAPAGVAARLAGPGQVVVVTLGGDGVAAGGEGVGPVGDRRSVGVDGSVGSVRIHGRRVTPVDTTGAGDCFGGVLAAGLAEGLALAAALDRANRAAALAVTRLGTVPAMPDRAEVLATIATPDH